MRGANELIIYSNADNERTYFTCHRVIILSLEFFISHLQPFLSQWTRVHTALLHAWIAWLILTCNRLTVRIRFSISNENTVSKNTIGRQNSNSCDSELHLVFKSNLIGAAMNIDSVSVSLIHYLLNWPMPMCVCVFLPFALNSKLFSILR